MLKGRYHCEAMTESGKPCCNIQISSKRCHFHRQGSSSNKKRVVEEEKQQPLNRRKVAKQKVHLCGEKGVFGKKCMTVVQKRTAKCAYHGGPLPKGSYHCEGINQDGQECNKHQPESRWCHHHQD